jgi:hypothetical protein
VDWDPAKHPRDPDDGLGFTPDPLEFGTDAHYGLTADQFEQWLAEH